MALQHQHKKKNHFPDGLFYLISAALIIFLSLFISYYGKTDTLTQSFAKTTDSLNIERTKVEEIKGIYENQGRLVIKNTGSNAFHVTDFYITYYDTTSKKLQTFRGMIDGDIDKNGTCSPACWKGTKCVWNGEVLFYFLSIKGGDIGGNGARRYFAGNWEKGKTFLGVSLDGKEDNTYDIYAKCSN